MDNPIQNSVLFLCTGNYYRSRWAEICFNRLALRAGLPWKAHSRGLTVAECSGNVGPLSEDLLQHLRSQGITWKPHFRMPKQVEITDLEAASQIIALKETEHRPMMKRAFSAWEDQILYWNIEDVRPSELYHPLNEIEKKVTVLIDTLHSA